LAARKLDPEGRSSPLQTPDRARLRRSSDRSVGMAAEYNQVGLAVIRRRWPGACSAGLPCRTASAAFAQTAAASCDWWGIRSL